MLSFGLSYRMEKIEPRNQREGVLCGLVRCSDQTRHQPIAHLQVLPHCVFCRLYSYVVSSAVMPGSMVSAVKAENSAQHAMRRPTKMPNIAVHNAVPTAVAVDIRLHRVHTRIDHRLHCGIELHAVARPPHRKSPLRWVLRERPWYRWVFTGCTAFVPCPAADPPRLSGRELRERYGATTTPRIIVVSFGDTPVQVAPPRCVVQAIPIACC